ncbi:MAG: hypothetical protein ACYCU0_15210, partial [Solirubrobacteraceae bacterium]
MRTTRLSGIGGGLRSWCSITRARAQLERLRELYVMGDLTKSQYVMRAVAPILRCGLALFAG